MGLFTNCFCNYEKAIVLKNEYIENKTIKNGKFGKVKLIQNIKTNISYILKEIDKEKITSNTYHEIKSLTRLNLEKKYIVKLKEYTEDYYQIKIILEKIEGITLDKFIKKKYDNDLLFLFYNLLKGLDVIHKLNILHGNIYPENIMIKKLFGQYQITYIDFGLSYCSDKTEPYFIYHYEKTQKVNGNYVYLAPEVFFYQKYIAKSDCWSLGVIFYELLYQKLPYKKIETKNRKIETENRKIETENRKIETENRKIDNYFYQNIEHCDKDYLCRLTKNLLNVSYLFRWDTQKGLKYLNHFIEIYHDI